MPFRHAAQRNYPPAGCARQSAEADRSERSLARMRSRGENGGEEQQVGPGPLRRAKLDHIVDGCGADQAPRRSSIAATPMHPIRLPRRGEARRPGEHQHQPVAPRDFSHPREQSLALA